MNRRVIFVVGILGTLAEAAPQAYFSSEESIGGRMLQLVAESRQSIDLAVFELSSRPLVQGLREAQGRGVAVRILLNSRDESWKGHAAAPVDLNGFEVRWSAGRAPSTGFMHDKFVILDRTRVVTGSYNWTAGAEYSNHENVLLEDDPAVVNDYARQFARLWEEALTAPQKSNPIAEFFARPQRSNGKITRIRLATPGATAKTCKKKAARKRRGSSRSGRTQSKQRQSAGYSLPSGISSCSSTQH